MASNAPPSSAPHRNHRSFFTTGMAVIWFSAPANLLFHIHFNNRYGYFRDESLEARGYLTQFHSA
jgi:hypothetical protein